MRPLLLCLGLTLAAAADDPIARSLDAAVATLTARVQADPDDFLAAHQLLDRHLRRYAWRGRLDDLRLADEAADRSLRAMPAEQNPGTLAVRIQVRLAQHRFAEARDLAQQLAPLMPGRSEPAQLLGDTLLELGDLTGADRAWAPHAEEFAGSPGGELRHARLAWLRGAVTTAHTHTTRALEAARARTLPEPLVRTLLAAAELAFRTGDWPRTEDHLREAQKLAPAHWAVLDRLAELRGAQGRDAEAVALFTQAAELSERPEVWQALGDFHLFQKRPAEAKAAHDRALAGYRASLDRGEVLYIHHLAGFYADAQEDAAAAVKWARRDLELRQSAGAWDALAWALYRAGDLPTAREAAGKALADGLADPHVLYHAAMIAMSAGEIAEGQQLLRRCAAVNPHFQAFHVHR
jgi:tetratricopeptide (TPR) repeat protein